MPPPTLPLSAEAWGTLLGKTGAKKGWSTSALPVSMIAKSPPAVAVFSENYVISFKDSVEKREHCPVNEGQSLPSLVSCFFWWLFCANSEDGGRH